MISTCHVLACIVHIAQYEIQHHVIQTYRVGGFFGWVLPPPWVWLRLEYRDPKGPRVYEQRLPEGRQAPPLQRVGLIEYPCPPRRARGTAWGLGIEEPKHDLGWPPQRPLFRDTTTLLRSCVLISTYYMSKLVIKFIYIIMIFFMFDNWWLKDKKKQNLHLTIIILRAIILRFFL